MRSEARKVILPLGSKPSPSQSPSGSSVTLFNRAALRPLMQFIHGQLICKMNSMCSPIYQRHYEPWNLGLFYFSGSVKQDPVVVIRI